MLMGKYSEKCSNLKSKHFAAHLLMNSNTMSQDETRLRSFLHLWLCYCPTNTQFICIIAK